VRRSEKFGGNATTAAGDGLQFPPDSSASQSQNPAGSSVGVEAGQDTELAAKSGLPTPYSVVLDEVPKISGQATERATSGVPNTDSEGLGGRNEGSEEALVVQLHGAFHGLDRAAGVFHGVTQTFIAVLLRCVRSLDYNLRQKLCEYILPNGEKAGESSSKGNLAESSDAPHAKRKKQWESKNFPGVRQRNKSFISEIRLPGMKNKFWLGSYKTAEAAAQVRGAADNWLATRSGSKLLNHEERDELKKCAKKAGEHLSDYRSHHNVALPDLVENLEEKATALTSLMGNAVASAEHDLFSPSEFLDFESFPDLWG
jgi:hypothetical protein